MCETRIREVEALVGVTKKNIRFYEQEGLLAPARNRENSYREYSPEDVERLTRIKLLRKLGMPISEIREVLDRRLPLAAAAERHSIRLTGEIESLSKSRDICRMLAAARVDAGSLDAVDYLSRMERFEREGTLFVNFEKRDVGKKYLSAVLACFAVLIVMAAIAVGMVFAAKYDPIPIGALVALVALPVLVAVGTVASLISRIREIKGGEENDLGKY